MKKIYILFTGLLMGLSITLCAQVPSSSQNYVMETTVKTPEKKTAGSLVNLPVAQANRTISYFDGLGRPLQTVQWQGSPLQKDMVQVFTYDALGREVRKYLPYAEQSANNGSYKTDALSAQSSFYANGISWDTNVAKTAYPFSQSVLEASPLNRVLEQGAPGAVWQPITASETGHTIKMGYETNVVLDSVRQWTINITDNGASSTLFAAGKLYKTITKDENWSPMGGSKSGTIEEYKDLNGRVLLKKVWQSETSALKTQYIYDDFGNLRYVLPPAINATSFTESDVAYTQFIYGYRYDGRSRLVEKKIPGKGREFMVYNPLDQLVLSQDSVQRTKSPAEWNFVKYDAFGKVVSNGIYTSNLGRAALQAAVNTHKDQAAPNNTLWETRAVSADYSNTSFPTSGTDTHLINYYDNYSFPGNTFGGPTGIGQVDAPKTKGLLTGSKVKILGSSTLLLTTNYYDLDGGLVQAKGTNHLGGTDVVDNTYSFVGELKTSTRTHNKLGGANTTIANSYSYDHMGRKISTTSNINGQPSATTLNKMEYNETGQLKEKKLHSTDGTTFLQATKFAYNERGWLKNSVSPQFSMKLGYDTLSNPQYNGNIRSQQWGSGTTYPNQFNYAYDQLNRLTSATSTGIVMSETIGYDVMGNITSMNRDGITGAYSYTGNRLNSISGGLATGAYSYDANGNATTDGRKGVSLTYNQLNLPATAIKSGLNLAYTYDASGSKLKKVNTITSTTTDYVDGIQYTNGTIEFIQTEEGLARNNSGSYSYEYNLSDHLGNVRYTFNKHPSTGALQQLQADNYYAFGLRKVVSAGNNKFLYNSKELQEELEQYDYGARFYDPIIGRWNSADPLAEKFYSLNPYNYTDNNPINNIDPNGMETYYDDDARDLFRQFQSAGKKEGESVNLGGLMVKQLGTDSYEAKDRLETVEVIGQRIGIFTYIEKVTQRGGDPYSGPRGIEARIAVDNYVQFANWGTDNPLQEGVYNAAMFYATGEVGSFALKGVWNFGKSLYLGRVAAKTGIANPQLVQKSAALAERAIGGTGGVAGTAKHQYANALLNRYQSIYGSRGLSTNVYFNNGAGNRGFLDVLDRTKGIIYDFKFGNAVMSPAQFGKYSRNFGLPIQVIRP